MNLRFWEGWRRPARRPRPPAEAGSVAPGSTDLVPSPPLEDEQIRTRRAEQSDLEATLAQREAELATLREQLIEFERLYLDRVGHLYAELGQLKAELTSRKHRASREPRSPRGPRVQQEQGGSRRHEGQGAEGSTTASEKPDIEVGSFSPGDEMTRLFREAAKLFHPDLASDPSERTHRTRLMAAAISAYRAGDTSRLRALITDRRRHGDTAANGVVGELARVLRQITQVRVRLSEVDHELVDLRSSEMWDMKLQMDAATAVGWDWFEYLAGDLVARVEEIRRELARSEATAQAS